MPGTLACFTSSAEGGNTRFSCSMVSMLDMRSSSVKVQYKHQITGLVKVPVC